MIYFFNDEKELQKVVNSKNVINAVHEQELNGLILSQVELDLFYAKKFIEEVTYFGYFYDETFYMHKIKRIEDNHHEETVIIVGRHIFFEDMLKGKLIEDIRPVNRDAKYILENTVTVNTGWQIEQDGVTKHLNGNFYWNLPMEVIDKVVEEWQIDYEPRINFDGKKITRRYVHVSEKINKDLGKRIVFGSKVLELKYEIDYDGIITKLVVHGKGEEVGDGYGRRIDIANIDFNRNGVISPKGERYLYNAALIEEYGELYGREVFEDIEDVNELANAGYEFYLENSRPKMLFESSIAQIGSVKIGEIVTIIRREHDLYFKARIHKLSVDLLNPSDAQVELGDYEHFKHSKIERVQAKKEKNQEQQTNNRIESLKRQFDTEFDSQVDEFRKEFEQKLIDVHAEIEADKEAFELRYKADKEALSGEIKSSYDNAVTEANRIVEAKETDFKNYADGIGSAANGRIDSLYDGLGDLSSEFESLEIGGRNLLVDSINKGTPWDTPAERNLPDPLGSNNAIKVPRTKIYGYRYTNEEKNKFHPDTYTFSFYIKASKEVTINIGFRDGNTVITIIGVVINETWQKIEHTFTTINEQFVGRIYYLDQLQNTLDFDIFTAYEKLERGTKATDWTPAPEDTDQKLTIISNDLDGVQTKVENNTGAITTVTQQANGLETRVENAEGDITSVTKLANGIQTRVEDAEGNINTITNLANGTQQTVTNMLNGTATKGTVFQNTVDGFLNRVWQTDIDNLQIGGRNLIPNSKYFGLDIWVKYLGSQIQVTESDKTYNIKMSGGTSLIKGFYMISELKTHYAREWVTLSIKLKNNGSPLVLAHNWAAIGVQPPLETGYDDVYTFYGQISANAAGQIQFRTENVSDNLDFDIEWIKVELGSKPTDWSPAPEDNLKHTDLVMKSDGFLLGSFEMGGDKIAQAIVGKSGAIDLIAQNVNFTGNVNVANQIKAYSLEAVYADIAKLRTNVLTANSVTSNALKVDTALINKLNTNSILTNYLIADNAMIENIKSKSLEAVYANISELRTRFLVADVITADMVKFDTALIEKFTSNTAFINSLTAKNAFISNVKAIDIDLNRATVTGGDSTNYIRMTNQNVMSYGTFTRSWGGETDTARLELGLYDGQLRMRNLDTGYRLYLTERGLSTSMEGAIDQFTSGTLEFHSQRFNANSRGVTLHSSYGAVAMVSDFSTAVIRSNLTANIESNLFSIYFRPYRESRPGVNEFRLWVKDGPNASATDGVLSYGNADAGAASGIRFQKTTVGRPMIWATNGNGDIGTGNVRADSFIGDLEAVSDFVYAVGQRMRVISNKNDKASYADLQVRSLILEHSSAISNPGNQDVYFGVGGGELRLTNNNHYNAGSPSYRDLRLRTLRTMSSYAFENHSGGDTYFGVGGGTLIVTDNNHYNGGNTNYRDFIARKIFYTDSFSYRSTEEAKKDIKHWNINASKIIEHLPLFSYRYKDNTDGDLHHGVIIERGVPEFWLGTDRKTVKLNETIYTIAKALQEQIQLNKNLKKRIKKLEENK